MIPRDKKYVAIRLIRASPAPEIIVHMTTRTQSNTIVSASSSDTRSEYPSSIYQWRIPSTQHLDWWFTAPTVQSVRRKRDGSAASMYMVRTDRNYETVLGSSQKWSSHVNGLSFQPSAYSPGHGGLWEDAVFLNKNDLADFFVTNPKLTKQGVPPALVVNHGYVGHSAKLIFNTSEYQSAKSARLMDVFEETTTIPSSYYQTDILASSTFDQSALQPSDFPLSVSLASSSVEPGGVVFVSFIPMQSAMRMSLTLTLIAIMSVVAVCIILAFIMGNRKRCCPGTRHSRTRCTHYSTSADGDVAVVRARTSSDLGRDGATTPVVLELAQETGTALYPVAQVSSASSPREVPPEIEMTPMDGGGDRAEYPLATVVTQTE